MGGLVCNVHRNAILRFQEVPTTPTEQHAFDRQIRDLLGMSESIAQALELKGTAQSVCTILAKEHFTQADRHTLFDAVESTYE